MAQRFTQALNTIKY